MSRGEKQPADIRSVVKNRKATFNYEVEEELEVGLVLRGTEVKAIRAGKVQLTDAYAAIEKGEVFLHQLHIGEYEQASRFNHEPRRVRKLLLNKAEIKRLERKVQEKGYTLIPLELYFRGGRAKIRLGLCRGKKAFDKRKSIRDRDVEREMERDA